MNTAAPAGSNHVPTVSAEMPSADWRNSGSRKNAPNSPIASTTVLMSP